MKKTEEAGSASVSAYGSVLGYEQVTSQPSRPITVVWPEHRTWFIGPWMQRSTGVAVQRNVVECQVRFMLRVDRSENYAGSAAFRPAAHQP